MDGSLAALLCKKDEANTHLKDAQSAYRQAKDAVHDHLRYMGALYAATGERLLSSADVHDLYWDNPDVRVDAIAVALGVNTGDVHHLAGESLPTRCRVCDGALSSRRRSRATLGLLFDTDICPVCSEAQEQAAREARRRTDAQHQARLARVRSGDYWIDETGEVVFSLDPPWWFSDPHGDDYRCTGRFAPVPSDEDLWSIGGQVVYRCGQCHDRRVRTLVRYVPNGGNHGNGSTAERD